ncbi:MAG TPA: hypothetical protein VHA52_01700, partial [Candidatus Babeliaceae bacterium]|nr:hypothetical protein [Candidatus Babeliaceae bacterium]
LVGLKYDVNDNLDFLLKNYDQRSIAGFNGGIFQYDVNYKSIIRTTYENGSPSAKPASFSSQKGGKKKAKPLMLRTTNDCPIVYPEYIGLPDNIGEDCTVTLWHQTSYDLDGCLISDTYTFVSMTCPGSGSGSDTGSASASSSSGGGPEPPYGNGGGGDDDDDGFSFDSNLLLNNMNGTKPIAEYPDKCSGAQGIWTMATNNNKEVFGVMTADSQFMAVAMIGFEGGQFGGIYDEYGTEYYTYPDSLGLPSQTYSGMIHSAGQYFIPIIATIHTHNPCVVDGTDGVTNGNLSPEDIQLENNYTTINHYIIGCDALGKLNAGYNQAFLLATGTLSNTCSLIH